jgi:hypothetical protein
VVSGNALPETFGDAPTAPIHTVQRKYFGRIPPMAENAANLQAPHSHTSPLRRCSAIAAEVGYPVDTMHRHYTSK